MDGVSSYLPTFSYHVLRVPCLEDEKAGAQPRTDKSVVDTSSLLEFFDQERPVAVEWVAALEQVARKAWASADMPLFPGEKRVAAVEGALLHLGRGRHLRNGGGRLGVAGATGSRR
jgi:hypothetical protein